MPAIVLLRVAIRLIQTQLRDVSSPGSTCRLIPAEPSQIKPFDRVIAIEQRHHAALRIGHRCGNAQER